MKEKIINSAMSLIKNNGEHDEVKLAEIKYGLEGLYLTLTKLIVITIIACILNLLKEVVIFLIIYNFIRMPSFGLHATKSWICLLSSSLIFIMTPLICKYVYIPLYLKVILGIILILAFYKNAPADTKKRPIINPKRRLFYKYISVFIVIIFSFLSILINNNFMANCFILSLVVQSFMISPLVYKIFKLPYNNYLAYTNNKVI